MDKTRADRYSCLFEEGFVFGYKAVICFLYNELKRLLLLLLQLEMKETDSVVAIVVPVDGTAKGGLPKFWELFTVIPCTPKDFERQYSMVI